jgi:hypothetical protein
MAAKRGRLRKRPVTSVLRVIGARLTPEVIGRLDRFARREAITRSEALRRLIELGLKVRCRFSKGETAMTAPLPADCCGDYAPGPAAVF